MSNPKPQSVDSSEQIEFINEGELTMHELNEILDMLAENLILQNAKKHAAQSENTQERES